METTPITRVLVVANRTAATPRLLEAPERPFAAIIGTPALASIAHYTHWRISFVVLGAICLLLTGLIWRSVPHDAPFPKTKLHLGDVFRAYVPILGNRPLMLLYLSDVLRGVTWFGFLTYLAALAIQEYGLSLQQFGLLMFGGGSAYLAGTRLGTGRFPYMGLRTLLYSSIALMAVTGTIMFAIPLSLVALVLLATMLPQYFLPHAGRIAWGVLVAAAALWLASALWRAARS
jgi:predicted MFS family arabinose efflux permease